jgi:hypothetical protein
MSKIARMGAVVVAMAGGAGAARAETTECTVITSVPMDILTQGVYCLKGNLETSLTGGSAIYVNVNNVIIDFNGYKLGNLAAGPGTGMIGVYAPNIQNLTVRNGTIRGFRLGISTPAGSGWTIEDMIIDRCTQAGISLFATTNATVRRNRVLNTGGSTLPAGATGIGIDGAGARVMDNDVSNTFMGGAATGAIGIFLQSATAVLDGNRVTDSTTYGIMSAGIGTTIRGNHISNQATGNTGIVINNGALYRDNIVHKFTTAVFSGVDGGGNVSLP